MSTHVRTVVHARHVPLAIVAAIGGVEALMVWRFGWSVALLPYGYFGLVAVVLAARDLATHRLPNVIVLPSFPIAVALFALASAVEHDWGSFVRGLAAMLAVGVSLLLLAVTAQGQLGLGDVKLGALVGLYAGWLSWSVVLLAVLVGFMFAAMWGLPMAVRARELRYRLAFGPFLLVGAFVAILVH